MEPTTSLAAMLFCGLTAIFWAAHELRETSHTPASATALRTHSGFATAVLKYLKH